LLEAFGENIRSPVLKIQSWALLLKLTENPILITLAGHGHDDPAMKLRHSACYPLASAHAR